MEAKFAILHNDAQYTAKWDSDRLNKDQFAENYTINFALENWAFMQGKTWIKRRSEVMPGKAEPPFQLINQDYDYGNVIFKQVTDFPRMFQFDTSLVILFKQTKNLNILYTSTILSFVPRLFSSNPPVLEYCRMWVEQSNEVIQTDKLQNCPCTFNAARFDPDFMADPTCSTAESDCHENVAANRCFITNIDKTM